MGAHQSFVRAIPARRRPSPDVSSHDCPGFGPGVFSFPIARRLAPSRVAPAADGSASRGGGASSSVRRNALPSFDATVPSNCQSPMSSVSVSMLATQHGEPGWRIHRRGILSP